MMPGVGGWGVGGGGRSKEDDSPSSVPVLKLVTVTKSAIMISDTEPRSPDQVVNRISLRLRAAIQALVIH
jgi:hypothetical protein